VLEREVYLGKLGDGFETVLRVKGGLIDRVDAEALDRRGKLLGRTRSVSTETDIGASRLGTDSRMVVQS
jgi:hypothetical protein